MRKRLQFINTDIFLNHLLMQENKVIHCFGPLDESDAVKARDLFNVDLLISDTAGFILKHGGKLNHLFTGEKLRQAKEAKEQIQQFVTGCHNLKRKDKASPVFVWHLLTEFVLSSIGFLEHDRQPYAKDYGELLSLFLEFDKMYAAPMFEEETKS